MKAKMRWEDEEGDGRYREIDDGEGGWDTTKRRRGVEERTDGECTGRWKRKCSLTEVMMRMEMREKMMEEEDVVGGWR